MILKAVGQMDGQTPLICSLSSSWPLLLGEGLSLTNICVWESLCPQVGKDGGERPEELQERNTPCIHFVLIQGPVIDA